MLSPFRVSALHQDFYLFKVLESLNVFVLKVGERLSTPEYCVKSLEYSLPLAGHFRFAFVSMVNH